MSPLTSSAMWGYLPVASRRLTYSRLAAEPGLHTKLNGAVRDSLVLARRNLSHIRQIPEKLIDVTLQPLVFVILFAYVFGGVIAIPDGRYHEYLVGGVLVQTLAFGIMGPSIATNLTEAALAVVVMVLSGLVVGWRVHADVPHALGAVAVLLLFGAAMLWVGTLLGVSVRSPDAVTGVAFITMFPLSFLANAFLPAAGLPDGLQAIAEWNPLSAVIAAVRTLFGNPTATPADAAWPLQHPVIAAVGWSLPILAVAVPLTVWRFRARTTD
jgi:ABC-2 type transport system permease protein